MTTFHYPNALLRVARRQDGVVSRQQLAAHGVTEATIRHQLRLGAWVRVRRGAYRVLAGPLSTGSVRIQARAVVLTTPRAVLAGTTAGRLWGLDGISDGAVEVVLPATHPLHARKDLIPSVRALHPEDVTRIAGMPVTTVTRTLQDLVPRLGRADGLAVLDSALRTGRVTPGMLAMLREGTRGMRGAAHVWQVWPWADGRAESVLESRVRLRCLDAGLVPVGLQVEVRDAGFVARVDLAFRRRSRSARGLLLVEADGAGVHSRADALLDDRERSNRLVAMGHQILRFSWRDTLDPLSVPNAVRAAL